MKRRILSALPALAGLVMLVALVGAATAVAAVWTDRADYSPGSTVTISGDNSNGAGYLPGEAIHVDVSGPNGYASSCEAVADADGAWSCQVTIASDDSALGRYSYTAKGLTSGVSESGTFTDANAPGSLDCPTLTPHNNTHYKLEVGATVTCTIDGATDVSGSTVTVYIKSSTLGNETVTGSVSGTTITFTYTARSDGCSTTNVAYDTSGNTANNDIIDNGSNDGSGTAAAGFAFVDSNGDVIACGGGGAKLDLSVSKTATPSFKRTFTWGISKQVDKTEIDIADGGSATFNYTVNVTHDAGAYSDWQVNGTITVSNPNSFAVSGVNISDAIDNSGNCSVTNGSNLTVPANGSVIRSYSCTFSSNPASGTNTATATWSTFGSPNTSAQGTASYNFSGVNPTIVNGSVNVSDTLGGNLGSASYLDSSPKSFEYPHTFSGDPAGTCTKHDNTATITETDQSSGQEVKVCVGEDLSVSKDATPSFKRKYAWTITKGVDKTVVSTQNNTATFNYTVSVSHDSGTDSEWKVTGGITISNPNDWEAITANVGDSTNVGGTCTVYDGSTAVTSVTVAKSGSKNLTYVCTFTSNPGSGTNTATASWNAGTYFTPSGSANDTANFDFGSVAPVITDGSVNVSDTLGGSNLGSASYTDTNPKSFTYSKTFTVPAAGCESHPNTATFTTNTTGATGSASQTVRACRTGVLTDSQLCTFDVDSGKTGSQMRLIYTPDQASPAYWKLNASNPGQFYYNVIYAGSGPGQVTIRLPYPWVTQGAVPIHVYSNVTSTTANGQTCLTPGTEITNSSSQVTLSSYSSQTFGSTTTVTVNVPGSLPNGLAYINIHLDYGLKGTAGWSNTNNNATGSVGNPDILDLQSYAFSDSIGGSASVQNENVFKRDPGIGGLVLKSDGTPVPNVKVVVTGDGKTATVYTDADGWYSYQYKYTGKATTFTVALPAYGKSQSVTMKSNNFLVVSFTV
jgi:hypothetical protein